MRLVGYVRVSRVAGRQGDSFISPDVQRERLEAYCAAHGHQLVEVLEELDVSGAAKTRPAFEQALARVEDGADGLIVAKLDRFARSQRQALDALERIDQAGGVLISVEDNLDTSTALGRAMRSILLVFGELERERLKESWATAQERAVDRGVHIASRTPTGYVVGDDGRLQPHPTFAAPVAEAFRLRAAGASWSELAHHLEQHGVIGPYGNETWTTSSVTKIIRNRVYLGEARSGQHTNANAHEPLVSRTEWEAANAVNGHATTRPGTGLLLSGLLRCAGCRYALKGDRMKDRDGSRLGLYRCRGKHPGGLCTAPASALARVIEPHVEQRFLEALGPDGPLLEAVADTAELDETTRDLEAAEAELVAYRDANLVSVIGADAYRDGLEERARRVDQARQQVAETRRRAQLDGALPGGTFDLANLWPDMTPDEKRPILRAAIDAVFLRPGRAEGRAVPIEERTIILWRGEGPADLPKRGRRVPLRPFVPDLPPPQ